jgi:cathepsin X
MPSVITSAVLVLLLAVLALISAQYGQTLSSGYSYPVTPEYLQLEIEGKVEAPGVRLFPNPPEPTDKRFRPLTHSELRSYPTSLDWRTLAHLHSNVMTQRQPTWCGACFAFGAISSLTDRYLIHFPEQFPQTILSVQDVLNCASAMGFGYVGCAGSQIERVMGYIQSYGVVDAACNPYLGVQSSFTILGTDCWRNQCRQCLSNGSCSPIPSKRWGIRSWGVVSGEDQMIAELQNGPIACYINTHVPTYVDYKKGIMSDPTVFKKEDITHVVSILGYGQERNVPYWIARNWVNPTWGENGFFRVFRGNNTLNLESRCIYAFPDPNWIAPK